MSRFPSVDFGCTMFNAAWPTTTATKPVSIYPSNKIILMKRSSNESLSVGSNSNIPLIIRKQTQNSPGYFCVHHFSTLVKARMTRPIPFSLPIHFIQCSSRSRLTYRPVSPGPRIQVQVHICKTQSPKSINYEWFMHCAKGAESRQLCSRSALKHEKTGRRKPRLRIK